MIKFIGLSYYSFLPDGKDEKLSGYSMYFTDDEINTENAIGLTPFKVSVSPEKASSVLGILKPADKKAYEEYIGRPCEIAFDRNKHMNAIKFLEPSVASPAEHNAKKPNKLGENPQT